MSNIVNWLYLISAICFIFALQSFNSPKNARHGNWLAMIGMAGGIIAALLLVPQVNYLPIMIAIASGGIIGGSIAYRIEMTAMPQLVALFHSLVGLAAVCIAYAAAFNPSAFGIGVRMHLPMMNIIEIVCGAVVGAITFSGSVIAFAKLQGLISPSTLLFRGQIYVNLLVLSGIFVFAYLFGKNQLALYFHLLIICALIFGVLLIIPIGGADMPVVVSMLNSYSGWAAAGIGFTLQNILLVIVGALVGASGAILSYVMCKGMNRSLIRVIFGAFYSQTSKANNNTDRNQVVRSSSPLDAAYLLANATNVIIVPGYGMAVSQAQHALKELTALLEAEGVRVRYAIHPVAGRMPGHMNVLLAEAGIDYDNIFELEEINRDFAQTDIVLVVGANDVTNPAARTDTSSPIYGMPILDVDKAKMVLFLKRSMSPGYSGVENELFYRDNTFMLFGDAKKVIEEIIRAKLEN